MATFQLKIPSGHQNNQTISTEIFHQSEPCQVTLSLSLSLRTETDPKLPTKLALTQSSCRSETLLSPSL